MLGSFLGRFFRGGGKVPAHGPRHPTRPSPPPPPPPGPVYGGLTAASPPPPPPPPAAEREPGEPRVRLILADGRVTDAAQDDELAQRIGYLARNLVERTD